MTFFKGAVPISGLFDLAPFPYTYLQPAIQLTWEQVRSASPLLLDSRQWSHHRRRRWC